MFRKTLKRQQVRLQTSQILKEWMKQKMMKSSLLLMRWDQMNLLPKIVLLKNLLNHSKSIMNQLKRPSQMLCSLKQLKTRQLHQKNLLRPISILCQHLLHIMKRKLLFSQKIVLIKLKKLSQL
uniref:Uncharacterized protein n=1 Tax=Cacopsylla melanoneura TaxID=428564 RepID=A0A8D8SW16_9HEMI